MEYQVLARKWRPQQFDDVVGQEHVVATLKNALKAKRLAHAYLFVGPRGTGKTSIARIFAKALNCQKGDGLNPCDACDSCREIANGTSMDVLEIDGASNNGVEQVRDLRDNVKFMPTRGKYRVYIIDEVHMLSTAAFNALLKTLEEPPPHVKFIFATTEPDKVLATIISRCQRFDLRRIPTAQIVERLRLVAKEEKVAVDDDALLAVARGAEGGLRDAESALDQLISFKGRKITEEDVLSVFGLASRAMMEDLAGRVLAGDVQGVIRLVAELDQGGKDLHRLTTELLAYFRDLLVCMHVDKPDELELSTGQVETLKRQAQGTNADRVLRVARIIGETLDGMRFALSRRTLLEMALIRCARAAVVVSLEEILKRINELRDALPGDGGAAAGPASPTGAAPQPLTRSIPPASVPAAVREAPAAVVVPCDAGADGGKLRAQWPAIAQKVGRMAVMAGSALADARPLDVAEDRVVLAFDREFSENAAKFDVPRNRKALEHAISEVLGRKVVVEFRLVDRAADPVKGESNRGALSSGGGVSDAEDVEPEAEGGEAPPAPPLRAAGKAAAEVVRRPEVEKVLDLFSGSVVEVRG
jgi:DNA polymerase-3 subunit gamma/tau